MAVMAQPGDAEFEPNVNYHLMILQQMIGELPDQTRDLLNGQLEQVVEAIQARDKHLKEVLIAELQDLHLSIKTLEFDRESTQRERDTLQQRIDEL